MYSIVVPYQVTVPNERPTANVALVVLARRVGPDVNGELGLAGKRHRATVAAKRLFGYVGPSGKGTI